MAARRAAAAMAELLREGTEHLAEAIAMHQERPGESERMR